MPCASRAALMASAFPVRRVAKTPLPRFSYDLARVRKDHPGKYDAAIDWLQSPAGGLRFAQPTLGKTNFATAHRNRAFPLNPVFASRPPLSAHCKDAIVALHHADPLANSVPRIAAALNIEPERVKAVLRFGLVKRDLVAAGGRPQNAYAAGMDAMLASRTPQGLKTLLRKTNAKLAALQCDSTAIGETEKGSEVGASLLEESLADAHVTEQDVEEKVNLGVKRIPAESPYLIAIDETKVFTRNDALSILWGKPQGRGGKSAVDTADAFDANEDSKLGADTKDHVQERQQDQTPSSTSSSSYFSGALAESETSFAGAPAAAGEHFFMASDKYLGPFVVKLNYGEQSEKEVPQDEITRARRHKPSERAELINWNRELNERYFANELEKLKAAKSQEQGASS